MASLVLLVHDDLASIAAVRRLLARAGHEVVLATSVADAVVGVSHYQPAAMLLAQGLESGRGSLVLAELAQAPDASELRVLVLGAPIEGSNAPAVGFPLKGEPFLQALSEVLSAPGGPGAWGLGAPEPASGELARTEELAHSLFDDVPGLEEGEAAAPGALDRESRAHAAAELAFEEAHREVEDEALAELELTLGGGAGEPAASSWDSAAGPDEDALRELEDEVRAEAARRREKRRALAESAAAASGETDSAPGAEPGDLPLVGEIRPVEPLGVSDGARGEDVAGPSVLGSDEQDPVDLARGEEGSDDPAIAGQFDPPSGEEDPGDLVAGSSGDVTGDEEAPPTATFFDLVGDGESPAAADSFDHPSGEEGSDELAAARSYDLPSSDEYPGDLAAAGSYDLAGGEEDSDNLADADSYDLAGGEEDPEDLAASESFDPESGEGDAAGALDDEEGDPADELEDASAFERFAAMEAGSASTQDAPGSPPPVDGAAGALLARLGEQQRQSLARAESLDQEAAALAEEERRAAERIAAIASRARQAQEATARAQEALELRRRAQSAEREQGVREEAARVQAETVARLRLEAEAQRDREEAALRAREAHEQRARELDEEARVEREERVRAADALGREREERERLAVQLEATARREREERDRWGRELEEATSAREAREDEVRHVSLEAERMREENESLAREVMSLRLAAGEAEQRAEEERRLRELEEEARREAEAATERAVRDATEAASRAEASMLPVHRADGILEKIPRGGIAPIERLGRVVVDLCAVLGPVRLELKVEEVVRVLWMDGGSLIAAASTAPEDSLLERARADGLIDGAQLAELRLLGPANTREQLSLLTQRGYVRSTEVVPLVQRSIEHIALQAWSEQGSLYRISQEGPPPELPIGAVPRAAVQILAEALRRGLDPDALVAEAGGLRAVPVSRAHRLDIWALELTERERRLLAVVDGVTPLEELLASSALPQEAALRWVCVACALGLLELLAAKEPASEPPPELEVERLRAKYDQVQEADYFAILGLTRSAGGQEVGRAFAQLQGQFDPLRFVGHPDRTVLPWAEAVQRALSEAAGALADDRLRAQYARSLVD